MNTYKYKAFTLIELLVVIAIIGILASVVLSSLNSAREKAKIAKAKSAIQQILSATQLLYDDVGIFGAGAKVTTDPSLIQIFHTYMGGRYLAEAPVFGDPDLIEVLTQEEIDRWKGPYYPDMYGSRITHDPFGNFSSRGNLAGYMFLTNQNVCINNTVQRKNLTVVSRGPDKVFSFVPATDPIGSPCAYTGDDIYQAVSFE